MTTPHRVPGESQLGGALTTAAGDPLVALRVLGRMRADLLPIADAAGVPLPGIGSPLADVAAFVAQLPPGQAAEAMAVLARVDAELAEQGEPAGPCPAPTGGAPRGEAVRDG